MITISATDATILDVMVALDGEWRGTRHSLDTISDLHPYLTRDDIERALFRLHLGLVVDVVWSGLVDPKLDPFTMVIASASLTPAYYREMYVAPPAPVGPRSRLSVLGS